MCKGKKIVFGQSKAEPALDISISHGTLRTCLFPHTF